MCKNLHLLGWPKADPQMVVSAAPPGSLLFLEGHEGRQWRDAGISVCLNFKIFEYIEGWHMA